MENHYPIANFESFNSGAYRSYYARSFVSKDPRSGVRSRVNLLQVSAANATRVHADQDLSRRDFRNSHRLYADIINAAIHSGLHVCGKCRLLPSGGSLSKCGHELTSSIVNGHVHEEHT